MPITASAENCARNSICGFTGNGRTGAQRWFALGPKTKPIKRTRAFSVPGSRNPNLILWRFAARLSHGKGGLMDQFQQLQQLTALSSGPGSGILKSILMMWLIWPVLCGLIGAGRGKAMSGFMQGLFWGAFGLLPVLLSQKK